MNKCKIDGTGYAISICKRKNIRSFLDYIGDCPFTDYAYKWDMEDDVAPRVLKQYSQEWLELYKAGISTTLIGEAYKCSASIVSDYLLEYGIYIKELKPDYLYRWMDMISKGFTIQDIINKYHYKTNGINKIISYLLGSKSYDTSRKKGVCKYGNGWMAYIRIDHKTITLGHYESFNDAVLARIKAEDKYYTTFEENANEESNS